MDASSAYQDSLPIHPDTLLAKLYELQISYDNFSHPPLRTVADSKGFRENLLSTAQGGGHIKNLYLRDKKKKNFLAVIQEDKDVDLKSLADQFDAARFSFGSEDRLLENLGVRPGAVTPLAMMHGSSKNVTLGIDKQMMDAATIYMHPLVNDRTIGMKPDDLLKFLSAFFYYPYHAKLLATLFLR